MVHLRSYQPDDMETVIRLWNRCLPRDPVTERIFMRKVLMDPNLDLGGCLVAENRGQIVGFVLALVRRVPLGALGLQEDTGWISALFVHPDGRRKGIGGQLMEAALDFLRSRGRRIVWFSSYTPNYFTPGVDLDVHAEAMPFFERYGFEKAIEVMGMAGSILDLRIPDGVRTCEERLKDEGISVQPLEPKYTFVLLSFLETHFPGDWSLVAWMKLMQGADLDEFLIALSDDGQVVGYAQYEGEHFGPFGVSEVFRGKGVGSVLFYKTVQQMKAKGYRYIWVAWTHGGAVRFYERAGMRQNRRHAIMRKVMEDV